MEPEKARGADEVEFAEFVRGSQRRLRRLAYLVCGDWHRAKDIVQTALTRLYARWSTIRREDGPDRYVTVYTHKGPLTELCPVGTGIACTTRELPDGGRVLVAKLTYGTGSFTDNLIVFFLRPNEEVVVVVVGLSAVAPEPPESDRDKARRQISTWIESYTDQLIAAALDDRMRPDAA